MKKYENLKNSEYSKEQLEDFAELVKDIKELEKKQEELKEIYDLNKGMFDYIWTIKSGEVILIEDISHYHLENIIERIDSGEVDISEKKEMIIRKAFKNRSC
jgi:RNA polymerase-interacting CarD/CdnL/TRCF family regulator